MSCFFFLKIKFPFFKSTEWKKQIYMYEALVLEKTICAIKKKRTEKIGSSDVICLLQSSFPLLKAFIKICASKDKKKRVKIADYYLGWHEVWSSSCFVRVSSHSGSNSSSISWLVNLWLRVSEWESWMSESNTIFGVFFFYFLRKHINYPLVYNVQYMKKDCNRNLWFPHGRNRVNEKKKTFNVMEILCIKNMFCVKYAAVSATTAAAVLLNVNMFSHNVE